MPELSILMKPASSLCNLRCKYCFYADISDLRQVRSYGKMSRDTVNNILDRTFAYADHITYAFQGGEPTLAGLSFFEYFTDQVRRRVEAADKPMVIRYALQTNGTLLDEDWCRFLRDNRFLVGLSLDGPPAFHDPNRVDTAGNGTFSQVHRAKQLLDRFGVEYNVLWVLTNYTARFPRKVWKFLCDEEIRYVQFIPCLGPMEDIPSPCRLTPDRFCKFYTELYDLWEQDLRRGNYRSVKLFDDLFNLLLRHQVTACGLTGHCSMQFIVEGDGSVYPCDFYVLDQWKCGNFNENTVEELAGHPAVSAFLQRDHQISPVCQRCPWWNICGGGCMRMRRSMYLEPGSTQCGYGSFLTLNKDKISRTAALLSR